MPAFEERRTQPEQSRGRKCSQSTHAYAASYSMQITHSESGSRPHAPSSCGLVSLLSHKASPSARAGGLFLTSNCGSLTSPENRATPAPLAALKLRRWLPSTRRRRLPSTRRRHFFSCVSLYVSVFRVCLRISSKMTVLEDGYVFWDAADPSGLTFSGVAFSGVAFVSFSSSSLSSLPHRASKSYSAKWLGL